MKRDEEGVHSIANTENSNRIADIVFVHGLQGSSHGTWTYGIEGSSEYFFWPEQLGRELPDCGIWSIGYSAGITELGKPGMLIEKRALNLVSQFGVKNIGDRPVIFICHSMGGLLVKELAVRGALPSDAKHSQLVKNIRGIIFCGTPHRGSALASLASFLGVAQRHVRQMKGNEEALDLAHERFVKWLQSNPIEVLTFAESYPLKRQTFLGRFMPRLMVVPRASANPDVGNLHDVDADHLSLVKPKSGDLIYEASLQWLRGIAKLVQVNPPVIPDATFDPSVLPVSQHLVHSASSTLVIDLGNEKEERLKIIQKKLSEGYYASAEQDVRILMANASTWRVLSVSTRAKAHRALIQAVLYRQMKTADAKALLSQARAECPNERFVTIEALIAITDGNEKAMLDTYPNPVTEQEWRWKLLLLINDGQYDQAIRSALDPAAPFACSPTIQGCLAWAYLGLKKLVEAGQVNQTALDSQPESLGNVEAKALIEYAHAISPHSSAWLASAYPLPLDVECVYSTPKAAHHLAQSATLFESLAARMDVGSVPQVRYLTWSLACWCNLARINPKTDIQPVDKALGIFQRIQEQQPGFSLAVHWALLTRLPVDMDQLEHICRSNLTDNKIESIEALCQLYLHQGKEIDAAELLDKHKEGYRGEESCKTWRHYRIQLAGSLGQMDTIKSVLIEATDEEERLHLRALSLRVSMDREDYRDECLSAHVDVWKHTQKITDLFTACEIHATLDSNEFVIDHADTLLRELPAKPTLQVVLAALNNARQWQKCLHILNQHRNLFNEANSAEFLWIEFEACFQLGEFPRALNLIKQIVQRYPTQRNVVTWFDRAAQAGNHQHMTEAAQMALQSSESPAEHVLHMADHLVPIHPELSQQLFNHAALKPEFKTPQVAAFAFLLANRLGISDQLAPEVVQSAISPGGPMKAFTFEQTIDMMRQQQSVRAEQEEQYRLGRVYVHAYANSTGYPISAIFHDACPPASSDYFAAPTRLWSARLRHGRRCCFSEPPISRPWRLHLDVTSLLAAHRLGMLRVLEKSEAELCISPKIPGLLLEEMKKLAERQPSREKEVDQLLALVDSGRIRVTSQSQSELPNMDDWASGMTQNWKRAFSAAVESGGVLIDFWPLDWDFEPDKPLEIPENLFRHAGGPSGLIQGMIDAGWIEELDIRSKIQRHSTFHPASPCLHLEHASTVILDTEIARSLMNVGALDSLISSCKVWITYEEEQRCREAQRQAKYQDEVRASIDVLQKHLHSELGRRFQAGPTSTHDGRHQQDSTLFRSLLDFTAAAKVAGTILVSEDRWMTGFLSADQSPIVGFLDVLYWLHKDQQISSSEFFGSLHRLRLGNARFIPISKEELLFRLKSATNLHTQELRETPELEVIRRYYAACFLDAKSMQLRQVEDVGASEICFLTQIVQEVAATLADLWTHEPNQQIKENKATWLIHALVTDVAALAIQQIHPKAEPQSYRVQTLSDLFCMFCTQIGEQQQLDMLEEYAGSFVTWLISSLQLPAKEFQRCCHAVQSMVRQFNMDHPEQEANRGMLRFGTRIILSLLNAGRGHLSLTQEERELFGIVNVILINDVAFDRKRSWEAIGQALNGNMATISSQQPRKEYQVSISLDMQDPPCVSFTSGSDESFNLQMEELHLASPEVHRRISFLHSKRLSLDISEERAQLVFDRIAAFESPVERIAEYTRLQEESTTIQFNNFRDQHQNSRVNFGHIEKEARPLGCASLLRHIGIEPGDLNGKSLSSLMADLAPGLIDDHGLFFAFARQASLPVNLPNIWAERIFALPDDELDIFVRHFEDITASPLIRLQLACLLLRSDSPRKERGKALFDLSIGDDARESWGFFNAVLQWSWRCLAARDDDFSQEEMLLCAWLHAGIFQFWLPRPSQARGVIDAFKRLEQTPSRFFEHRESRADVAHPLHFSAKWLLIHTLPQLISLNQLPCALAESLKEKYRTILFSSCEATTPDTSTTVLRCDWTNMLGTFLAPASEELLNGWVTDGQQVWINQQAFLVLIQRHCENPEHATSSSSWLFLSNTLSGQPAPESLRTALQFQLEAFDVSKLQLPSELAAQCLWIIARFVIAQRKWFRPHDEVHWTKLMDDILAALEKLEGTDFEEFSLDLAFTYSFACADMSSERAAKFADTVIQMVRKRPAIATKAWEGLSRIVQAQKHANQPYLWPMLAEVRALAGRFPR